MKTTLTILAAALCAVPAMAATTNTDAYADVPAISAQRLSGAFVVGYDSLYAGRGLVISHSVAEGDGAELVAMKLAYDFGRKSYWSVENTISYRTVASGHRLYGNPQFADDYKVGLTAQAMGLTPEQLLASGYNPKEHNLPIKQANLENELSVTTTFKYQREKWNVSMGHFFVHGGILGVMAKHFRGQGASCTNELFITPAFTPYKWVDAGVTTRLSIQGITGWWFEPYITFKAPVIGTPEDVKLAAMLTFAMTATADYYNEGDFACSNGSQAYWIKLSLPYFATKNLIVTPYVSTNWLGKGAVNANVNSKFRQYTHNHTYVPFRNFAVVGGISVAYTF